MEDIIAMVKIFAGPYAPRNWAFCDGSILPIRQYTALFSLLGTNYGGDGRTTFALPDLRGRAAIGGGLGINPAYPNLNIAVGDEGGTMAETLTIASMPAHLHMASLTACQIEATVNQPQNNLLAYSAMVVSGELPVSYIYNPPGSATVQMANGSITNIQPAGDGQLHNNMQPFLGLNYIICIEGIFPQRP